MVYYKSLSPQRKKRKKKERGIINFLWSHQREYPTKATRTEQKHKKKEKKREGKEKKEERKKRGEREKGFHSTEK